MASFNKVILIGNLTRDPSVKYTTGGTAIAEIGLAVNRDWFDKTTNQKKSEVTFVDVTYFGKIAEVIGEYMKKGSSMLVEGRLSLDSWDDKATGQKRTKLKVVGEQMTMLGGRSGGQDRQQDHGSEPQQSEPQPEPSYQGGSDEVPF